MKTFFYIILTSWIHFDLWLTWHHDQYFHHDIWSQCKGKRSFVIRKPRTKITSDVGVKSWWLQFLLNIAQCLYCHYIAVHVHVAGINIFEQQIETVWCFDWLSSYLLFACIKLLQSVVYQFFNLGEKCTTYKCILSNTTMWMHVEVISNCETWH